MKLLTLALTVLAILFAGSACCPQSADTAPRIRYGSDVCDECGMIVSEERFAAAIVSSSGGEVRRFDGIGCLLRFREKNTQENERVWVHDYEGGQWIHAKQAFFVSNPEIITPMGDGLIAFSSETSARKVGELIQKEELQ